MVSLTFNLFNSPNLCILNTADELTPFYSRLYIKLRVSKKKIKLLLVFICLKWICEAYSGKKSNLFVIISASFST